MAKQLTLEKHFSKEELIALCHSRIPRMRHIEGFLDSGFITPLPIWSPVPEKYRKTARDSFSIWGLEAQHPKYLPAALQPFVSFVKRGKGKRAHSVLTIREGAYKNRNSSKNKERLNKK